MGVVQPPRPRSVWTPARALLGKRLASGSGSSLTRSLSIKVSHRESSFLQGMRPALSVAQVFGVLPVAKPTDYVEASFKWRSFRVVYSFLIVIGTCAESVLSLMRMLETGVRFITSVNVIFFTTSMMGAILILYLGTKWRTMVSAWARVEFSLARNLGTPLNFKSSMLIATFVTLSVAAAEHILSICSTLTYVWPCYQKGGLNLLIQGYFLTKYMKTFTTISYSLWRGLAVLFLQFIATFTWNFLDLFTMLIALGISGQFRTLNIALEDVKGQAKSDSFWRSKRELYTSLCSLTKHTDSLIGPIVLLSYASNLYFICLQCIVVTKRRMSTASALIHTCYFYFSLIFLISRTGTTSYVTALIYDESKRPKDVLYSVPSEGYNTEVQRFLTQVTTDTVALSGCNFFSVTRSLILTVIGTVVTYLVVLIQFESGGTDPDAAQSNNTVACTCADLKVYNC